VPLVELLPRKKRLLPLVPKKKRRSLLAHGDLVALRLNLLSPLQVSPVVPHLLLLPLPSQQNPLQVSLAVPHLPQLLLLSQPQQLPLQIKRMRRVMTLGASVEVPAEKALHPRSEKTSVFVEVNSSIIYGIYFKVNCK
jgi:hypothetical protein